MNKHVHPIMAGVLEGFTLSQAIAKANAEQLDRLNVWDSQALTIPAFLLKPSFAEIVQDRASELLTGDFENKQRCREIADELYQLATRML